MPNIVNQKVLQISDKTKTREAPEFITEDVVEERRAKMVYYKWIARLTAMLAICSLLYGVCTTLAIMKLAPEIMIDPLMFVEFSDSQSLVKREYINFQMESREQVMVNFMKQYVELRNTYIKDAREMQNRWLWGGLVSYLSTYEVYKEFEKVYPLLTAEMIENNSSRSVEILSVERTGGENSNTWKIEFKTYDYTFKSQNRYARMDSVEPIITERFWTANIRGYVNPRRRTAYRRLLNPLGFVVYSYFQSEIDV